MKIFKGLGLIVFGLAIWMFYVSMILALNTPVWTLSDNLLIALSLFFVAGVFINIGDRSGNSNKVSTTVSGSDNV